VIKEISSSELKELIEKNEAKVVDCREQFERDQSYIPGTIFIPMNAIPSHLDELKGEKMIVFTCRTGNRSYHVCQWLKQQQIENVANHTGGITDWVQNGYDITR